MSLDHTYNNLPKYTTAWSEELGKDVTEAEWGKAFFFTHKSSISSYTQEKNDKITIKVVWGPNYSQDYVPIGNRYLLEM